MISLQAALNPQDNKATPSRGISLKKRKWDHGDQQQEEEEEGEEKMLSKQPKLWQDEDAKESHNIELNLDSPLPAEWQRCLDIKSGEIHYYNTRTHRRTYKDPRDSPETPMISRPLSLDLELNLACDPKMIPPAEKNAEKESCKTTEIVPKDYSMPWVSFDADRREMVAAVCARCHMLVMMCKASPSCPNCKFLHPPPELKPGFRLLCCED